jgi:NifU-like protein involved in Fe-S cluster formation
MSRARDTAGIIQYNKISIDSNNAVGIGSSIPDTKLDVNGGVRVTGIVTAAAFEGDGSQLSGISTENLAPNTLVVAGISTFNGNVLINGNNEIRLGTGGNSFLYHGSDNDTYLQTNNNELLIGGPTVRLQSYGSVGSAGENYLVATKDGSVDLYYDNSKKFETVGAGISISGNTETRDLVSVKSTDGTPGRVDLYCEVSNAHYARLVAPAHSEFSGNVTATLPTKSGDIIVGNTGHIQITDSINTTGIITAASFSGSGSGLTGLPASFSDLDAALFS